MYLKKSYNPKTGRTYLSAATNYHDPVKKQSRTRTIESFGYVDVLVKQYPDPIAHFTAVVEKMDAEKSSLSPWNRFGSTGPPLYPLVI